MNLQQLVDQLDARVATGDIIAAFEAFAADNCVTLSGPTDITHSKAQKMDALRGFFGNVARINHIECLGTKVKGNVSDSQFVFVFTNHWGEQLAFNEVIRRTWQDNKIVEEYYLLNQTLGETEEVAIATPAKAPKAKAEPKPVSEKKAAAAKADKKPAAKEASPDDLTIIEGVGPKIADLLIKAGFNTFAKVAAAKPEAIREVLAAAGKRYQMHDPATWPQQAALARDGKTAELEKLQQSLNAGRK